MFIKLEKLDSKIYLRIDKIATLVGRFKEIPIIKECADKAKTVDVLKIDHKKFIFNKKNSKKDTSLRITYHIVTGTLCLEFLKKDIILESIFLQLKPKQVLSFIKNDPKYFTIFDIENQTYTIVSKLSYKKETTSKKEGLHKHLKLPIDFDKSKLINLSTELVKQGFISSDSISDFLGIFIYIKGSKNNITWYKGEDSLHLLFTSLYKNRERVPAGTWEKVTEVFNNIDGDKYEYRTFVNKSKTKRNEFINKTEKALIEEIIKSI